MSGNITINFGGQLPFLNANIQWFQQRIAAGTQDGSLTQAEQQVLNPELSQIQQLEQTDLQSGQVNYGQTQQLWQQIGEMNRDIYSLRHNSLGTNLPESPNEQQVLNPELSQIQQLEQTVLPSNEFRWLPIWGFR